MPRPQRLRVVGEVAYIPDLSLAPSNGGFVLLDVSDPFNPGPILGSISGDSDFVNASDVRIRGNIAFVLGQGNENIISLDVTDPSNPIKLDTVRTGNLGRFMEISGDVLYFCTWNDDRINRVHIRDPRNMTVLSHFSSGTNILNGPTSIAIAGRTLYCSATDTGPGQVGSLTIIDIGGATLGACAIGNLQTSSIRTTDASVFEGPVDIQNTLQTNTLFVQDALTFQKQTVSQTTNINTNVTLHQGAGKIITQNTSSIGGNGSASFVVFCNVCTSKSIVHVDIQHYTGTYGSDGIPIVYVHDINDGSFELLLYNNSGNGMDGILTLGFVVV
jgi:hypothetical protein